MRLRRIKKKKREKINGRRRIRRKGEKKTEGEEDKRKRDKTI